MALGAGTRIGPYEVVSSLGAGGMGEVYRASDSRLKRDVALKILPESFASDPERLARFEREAQVLASLNHPNIAAIYGLEIAGPTTQDPAHVEDVGRALPSAPAGAPIRALVLEFVDGPTLADRIASGPIPTDEALPIAKQIAEALEAAHEQAIIHRDLKPANVKVRPDGTVKVLDFGLAKLAAGSSQQAAGDQLPAGLSMSPTITSPALMTGIGVILGTAAYMSPEQAKGREADKRSDVWAFGCVLYEMLTGKRPFDGEDVGDTLAAVLRGEPDWNALPAGTPSKLRTLLRRCLEKNRKQRLHDIGDARLEIDELIAAPARNEGTITPMRSRWRERAAWSVALVALIALAVALGAPYVRTPTAAPEMRVEITTPETTDPISFAISPDGRQLVFVASGDGQSRLWLRPLDAVNSQPLTGTDGASDPFWSPDSRSVGFFANGKLKQLDIGGGAPQTLTDAAPRGGTWNADGVILYAKSTGSPLFRVAPSGGETTAVTKMAAGQSSHRFPAFLPGGRQFLFYVQGNSETAGIYLGSLDSSDTKRLTAADSAGVYLSPGWLLFLRQGTFLARHVDLTRGALTGDPVTLADPVGVDGVLNVAGLSASAAGIIAYRSGGATRRQLTWFDRSGKTLGTLGPLDEAGLSSPRLSPDGRRVAVYRTIQGNSDIWLVDGVRTTRLTFDPSLDRYPIWSPDGNSIVFDSNRKGHRDLYQKPSNGAGSEQMLVESTLDKTPYSWSIDGRFLIYGGPDPKTGYDLWALPLQGDAKPFVWLNASFDERQGVFSPDARWVAYASNESGRFEVYVRPFDGAGAAPAPGTASGQWQVSTAGGIWQRWSPDGKELFYIAPEGKMMSAPIRVTGATLDVGAPVALFQTRIVGGGTNIDLGRQYDVAADGRFLIDVAVDEATASPITLILYWAPGAKP